MKLWEAMRLLQEGKKIRKKDWSKDYYIFLDKDVGLMDKAGRLIPLSIEKTLFADMFESWEEYKDWTAECTEETKTVTSRICPHCCHKNYAPPAEAKYHIYCSYCGATMR